MSVTRFRTLTSGIWKPAVLLLFSFAVYLIIDYYGPGEITLRQDSAFDISCLRARDLIVQEYDNYGNLWATRGMIVYKMNKGDSVFKKVAHVPTGPSIFWIRNFTLVRRYTVRPECVEMVQSSKGEICALSAGKMWYFDPGMKKFITTLDLDHYGFGDQGIRNDGIIRTNDSTIYFGEYFRNPAREDVNIYESTDNGRTWNIVYTFQAGLIRHIHALQKDPYTGRLWICTGDTDAESMVAYSVDGFRSLVPIGLGSQLWRVCQLVFTEDAIYWGTDNSHAELAGIYSWNKKTTQLRKLNSVDGAVFFGTRLENGLIVMTTDREGFATENDPRTRLWVSYENRYVSSILGGTWDHNEEGFRFKFAQLRIQRNQGNPDLAVSVLNQEEFRDGDLLLISQDQLGYASQNQYEVLQASF